MATEESICSCYFRKVAEPKGAYVGRPGYLLQDAGTRAAFHIEDVYAIRVHGASFIDRIAYQEWGRSLLRSRAFVNDGEDSCEIPHDVIIALMYYRRDLRQVSQWGKVALSM